VLLLADGQVVHRRRTRFTIVLGAFGGPDQSVVTAGDHADDHFRLRPERRRALGGVEHAEPATGPRPDVDQPSSRAKGGFDEFYRLRHFAAGTGHGR